MNANEVFPSIKKNRAIQKILHFQNPTDCSLNCVSEVIKTTDRHNRVAFPLSNIHTKSHVGIIIPERWTFHIFVLLNPVPSKLQQYYLNVKTENCIFIQLYSFRRSNGVECWKYWIIFHCQPFILTVFPIGVHNAFFFFLELNADQFHEPETDTFIWINIVRVWNMSLHDHR